MPEAPVTQYTRNPPLSVEDLHADPLQQLLLWIDAAREVRMIEPTAMTLATATPEGAPSARVVLFKGLHDGQLCFYTHYDGRKARELEANPRAAITFWWDRLERQVRLEGSVSRLPREVSAAYFASRPRASQLGAHTSRQSAVVADRETLDARLLETERRYEGQAVPLPDQWGGYGLRPIVVEFWQGRGGRFHDRLRYRRQVEGWHIDRLEP